MRRKARPTSEKRPEAHHFEQAIDLVESFYPVDIFGKGDQPLPKDLPADMLSLVQAKASRMARMTCENIMHYAMELKEQDDKRE